jgi:hypothetical protein
MIQIQTIYLYYPGPLSFGGLDVFSFVFELAVFGARKHRNSIVVALLLSARIFFTPSKLF